MHYGSKWLPNQYRFMGQRLDAASVKNWEEKLQGQRSIPPFFSSFYTLFLFNCYSYIYLKKSQKIILTIKFLINRQQW